MAVSQTVYVNIIVKGGEAVTSLSNVSNQTTKVTSALDKAAKSSDFFARTIATLQKALVSMVGVTIAWTAIFTVPEAVIGNLSKLLWKGVEALGEYENRVISLAAVIATTTNLGGKNPAEQFQLGMEASNAVMGEFLRRGNEINGTIEEVTTTFQTLASSGIGKYNIKIKEAIDLSILLTNAITSVTIGQGRIRQLSQETRSLFGNQWRPDTNALQKLLFNTREEWQRFKDDALKSGKMVEMLTAKLEQFKEAAKPLGNSFEGIKSSAQDMWVIFSRMAFADIFEKARQAAIRFRNEFFGEENKARIVGLASSVGASLESIVKSVGRMFGVQELNLLGFFEKLAATLKNMAMNFAYVSQLIRNLGLIIMAVWGPIKLVLISVWELIKNIIEGMAALISIAVTMTTTPMKTWVSQIDAIRAKFKSGDEFDKSVQAIKKSTEDMIGLFKDMTTQMKAPGTAADEALRDWEKSQKSLTAEAEKLYVANKKLLDLPLGGAAGVGDTEETARQINLMDNAIEKLEKLKAGTDWVAVIQAEVNREIKRGEQAYKDNNEQLTKYKNIWAQIYRLMVAAKALDFAKEVKPFKSVAESNATRVSGQTLPENERITPEFFGAIVPGYDALLKQMEKVGQIGLSEGTETAVTILNKKLKEQTATVHDLVTAYEELRDAHEKYINGLINNAKIALDGFQVFKADVREWQNEVAYAASERNYGDLGRLLKQVRGINDAVEDQRKILIAARQALEDNLALMDNEEYTRTIEQIKQLDIALKDLDRTKREANETTAEVIKNNEVFQAFVSGFTDAIAAMIAGTETFASAMKKLAATVISAIGDIIIAKGAEVLAHSLWPPNPVGIAKGIAIMALGATIKGLAARWGGQGGGVSANSGSVAQGSNGAQGNQTIYLEPYPVAAFSKLNKTMDELGGMVSNFNTKPAGVIVSEGAGSASMALTKSVSKELQQNTKLRNVMSAAIFEQA